MWRCRAISGEWSFLKLDRWGEAGARGRRALMMRPFGDAKIASRADATTPSGAFFVSVTELWL